MGGLLFFCGTFFDQVKRCRFPVYFGTWRQLLCTFLFGLNFKKRSSFPFPFIPCAEGTRELFSFFETQPLGAKEVTGRNGKFFDCRMDRFQISA
jgi:hypothetical protein